MLARHEHPLDLGHTRLQRTIRAAGDCLASNASHQEAAARNQYVLRLEVAVAIDLVIVGRLHLGGHGADERFRFGLAGVGARDLESG